ncbi:hypothetical protein ACIQZG_20930 [Lysinibacillus sp. NPDC096418]|uniref:hypothetical protein n=1 Tax=Lysinibacillus sp. NPDC096418 TaxID=3364138 RepID=UPI0037F1CB91
MVIQTKKVAGNTIVWDDGLVNIGDAHSFIEDAKVELNRVKKEVVREHQVKHIQELSNQVKMVVADWDKQLEAQTAEAKAQLKVIQEEEDAERKGVRNLLADEVSVLAYQANILRSKMTLVTSQFEFKIFIDELLGAPEQVRQAFLDNATDIVRMYDPKIEIAEIKSIMQRVSLSLLSENEKIIASERNERKRAAENHIISVGVKELALKKSIQNLVTNIDWELIAADQAE